jgi:hypothetical protein
MADFTSDADFVPPNSPPFTADSMRELVAEAKKRKTAEDIEFDSAWVERCMKTIKKEAREEAKAGKSVYRFAVIGHRTDGGPSRLAAVLRQIGFQVSSASETQMVVFYINWTTPQ